MNLNALFFLPLVEQKGKVYLETDFRSYVSFGESSVYSSIMDEGTKLPVNFHWDQFAKFHPVESTQDFDFDNFMTNLAKAGELIKD
jgi:hypothetical protein